MKLEQYIPLAIRTEKPLPTLERLVHGCMGLITETGEVVTELKRMHIYGKPLDEERKKHICEEIGDVTWYVAVLLHAMQVPAKNVEKLFQLSCPTEDRAPALSLMLATAVGRICYSVVKMKAQGMQTDFDEVFSTIIKGVESILVSLRVLAETCNSTLEQCMAENIAKLQIRFPDAYSNEAAEGRADKAGADARNS